MAEPVTKEQYEFCRALYDEEERSSVQLEGRAKVFLGVISALLAAVFLKAADAKSFSDTLHIRWSLMLLEALPMTVALWLVLWALRLRNFEAVSDGPAMLGSYEAWPTQEQFFEDRMVDYAVASSLNRKLNRETASLLAAASWCMAAGVLYLLGIVVYVVYAVWRA